MDAPRRTVSDPDNPPNFFEIRLRGHLDERWGASLSGFRLAHHIDPRDGAVTTLRGSVADESELHGLLARIRDLGIPLLAVTRESGGDESSTCGRGSPTHEPRPPRSSHRSSRETKEDG